MKPIPPELHARWSPMWPANAHYDRPWWSFPDGTWTRADGFGILCTHLGSLVTQQPPAWTLIKREKGMVYVQGEPEEEVHVGQIGDVLARIDAAHPLPTPPIYAGQVWVCRERMDGPWIEECVVRVVSDNLGDHVAYCLGRGFVAIKPDSDIIREWRARAPWLEAILVAGPTPWGRDCPWSPA